MQPYFFPYLGYFDLVHQATKWIVFDTVQYIRHGWINRNRILHPNKGWQYIGVPLKGHSRDASIAEIEIARDNRGWQERILGQLQHYKKRAPYFRETITLVEQSLYSEKTSIVRLNVNCLSLVCQYLEMPFEYELFSEMHLELGPIDGPGDWALKISEALGATEYINPPGGVSIFEPEKFRAAGIKLTIRQLPPLEYQCSGYEFMPNLSVIDLLMWNSPQQIRSHLEEHGN
jgi:hypothetical protein